MNKLNWKMVEGSEGLMVSSMGDIMYSDGTVPTISRPNGYVMAYCTYKGKKGMYYVHRLVAEAFIPNPDNLPCINHINEIKDDNRIENLEWISYSANTKYSMDRRPTWDRNGHKERHVAAIDPDTDNVVGIYSNVRLAAAINSNVPDSTKVSIYNVINHKNNANSALGYKWKEISSEDMEKLYKTCPELFNAVLKRKRRTIIPTDTRRKHGKDKTPVIMIDADGKETMYDSVTGAAKAAGICYQTIIKCIQENRPTKNGMRWRSI